MSALDPRLQNLLFASAHLLRAKKQGDAHAKFREAWIDAARGAPAKLMRFHDEQVTDVHGAAIALFHAALAIAEAHGIPRVALVQAFNDRGESGVRAAKAELDQLVDQAIALVTAIAAEREQEKTPPLAGELSPPSAAEGAA
jgi:hypothetical protein